MNVSEILIGREMAHLERVSGGGALIHRDALKSFREMTQAAAAAGFTLSAVSGFRDFGSQMRIWNAKATGQRALLDVNGRALVFGDLSPEQIVWAILRWSALPGASRHHWGT